MIKRFSHVAFIVSNLARSIDWYRDCLGLEVVIRQRQDNDYTRELVGIRGAVLEVAHLRVPTSTPRDGVALELIEYVTPKGRGSDLAVNDLGATHVAFEVEDIHALHSALKEKDVLFKSPPVAITAGANSGGYSVYLEDPDGNKLELFQRPKRA